MTRHMEDMLAKISQLLLATDRDRPLAENDLTLRFRVAHPTFHHNPVLQVHALWRTPTKVFDYDLMVDPVAFEQYELGLAEALSEVVRGLLYQLLVARFTAKTGIESSSDDAAVAVTS